jgi:hypothetical protein
MACTVTFKCSSVTWNSHTWNATSGGPIECSYTHSGNPIENRMGDNEWPTVVGTPDKSCTAIVILREVAQVIDIDGTASDIVLTLAGRVGVSSTITLKSMVLVDVSGSQRRGEFGAVVLRMAHQSSDGTTVPVS